MPWIDSNDCSGCGICVEECPNNAITLVQDIAILDQDNCIRCGICHSACPREAVKHDSLLIPTEVRANIERVKNALEHFGNEEEKQASLTRWIKFFNKEKKIMEKTLFELESLRESG